MRIAYVATKLVDGDAQGNYAKGVIRGLKEHDVRVYTFTSTIGGVQFGEHGVKVSLRMLLRSLWLARELRQYDLIVIASPDIALLPGIHLAGKPKVWVYHGLTPAKFLGFKDKVLTHLRSFIYRISMKRSLGVLCMSRFIADEVGGDALPCFVPDDMRPTGKRGDYFLYVGRLFPNKRVDMLISALKIAEDRHGKRRKLVIAGDGPLMGDLKKQAAETGVDVEFLGHVSDERLKELYDGCYAFVTASEHEGFCIPVAEAVCMGKPAIVRNACALPDTVGTGGFLFNTVEELADLMSDMPEMPAADIEAMAKKYRESNVVPVVVEWIMKKRG